MNRTTTIILLLIWLLVMWRTVMTPPRKVAPPAEFGVEEAAVAKAPAGGGDEAEDYSELLYRLKSPFEMSRYRELLLRNIFEKPTSRVGIFAPERLKLLSTEPVTLPFTYVGYIQTADGTIIGQLNLEDKTLFVQRGDKFQDYGVKDIRKDTLMLEGKEGELTLEFKKPVKGKELVATLYDESDNKTYEVKKGEEINGYKILDITQGSVVLWGEDREWVIKGERGRK